MDIDLLSKMVKELILDNDRVVLPGLGCFVAEMMPSTFSDKGYTINPPYRRMYFRAKPDQDDALTRFYASSNKVEMAVADRIINDFTSELKRILHSRKTIVFPGLGRLRATKENNIFFVADEDLDIYPAGFGLEPISLKTHQETDEQVYAAVGGLKQILEDMPSDPLLDSDETLDAVPEYYEEEVVVEDEVKSEAESLPVSEPEAEPAAQIEPDVKSGKKGFSRVLAKIIMILLVIGVVSVAAYAVIGRVAPQLVDKYLYTEDELEILNYDIPE